MLKFATMASTAVLLAACASTPDVTYTYYPSRSNMAVAATETVSCKPNLADVNFSFSSTPTLTTTYAADHDSVLGTLRPKTLDGSLSDSDVALKWFDDGRLQSVNSSSTGEASAIVSSAIKLAGPLGALGGGGGAHVVLGSPCDILTKYTKETSLSFNFNYNIRLEHKIGQTVPLMPTSYPDAYSALALANPDLALAVKVHTSKLNDPAAVPTPGADMSGTESLTLQRTADVQADLLVGKQVLAQGIYQIPTDGRYSVPIPKGVAFGTIKFALSLNEAGAVTNIEYNKTNGLSQALDTATSIAQAVAPAPAAKPATPPSDTTTP